MCYPSLSPEDGGVGHNKQFPAQIVFVSFHLGGGGVVIWLEKEPLIFPLNSTIETFLILAGAKGNIIGVKLP